MLTFFRRIRKSLLASGAARKPASPAPPNGLLSGRTGRYIFYAIGEIALVVIGILLAIQINEWNNQRNTEKQNQEFLVKLLNDLKFNKNRMYMLAYEGFDDFNNGLPSIEAAIKEGKVILEMTYRGLKESDIEFLSQAKYHSGTVRMNINRNTYEEILNIGRLNSLGSDTLIGSIIEYYQYCDRMNEYNLENTEFVLEGLRVLNTGLDKLIQDYKMYAEQFSINFYPWYFNIYSVEYQDMQIAIGNILAAQQRKFDQANHFIDKTDSIIAIVEKEIGKF